MSPILPPSATSASAMVLSAMVLAVAYDGNPDAGKGRRDRRMRLVHGDPHPQDLREPVEDGFGHRAGRGLDQSIATGAKSPARDVDDLVVAHGMRELVGARRRGQIDVEHEVELEGLPDLGLVLHHAVIGMQRKPGDEDGIGHRALPMAAATRSACTVSATSWVRMIAAPPATASRWAAIDPPSRWSGGAGDTVSMKRLREAPTRSGSPNDLSSGRRAMAVRLCSGVLPKPMPGSSTMFCRAMPARAAMSSEREKNARMSATMSIAGSAASRLCMMITGTACWDTTRASSLSRCRPQTSLTMAAPAASAQAATSAFMVSIETGTPSPTTAGRTGPSRRISSAIGTATAPP